MADSSTEATREFLRFRDQGDPEAMAHVFDLVGPKLLLLAMHLTKDSSTAEDLVQTTFLQAIEGADRFDASYPSVMPWLSQILRRRAQDVHRKVERESRLLSAHQPTQALPLDPQAKLENEEAAKDFEDALESLPEKYRSVLILRLVQGMEPKDIGYSLGIDSGTVRTQLKRGLAWLRQRMRYGTALSIAISMIATRGIADVRRVVLERAALEKPPLPWWNQIAVRQLAAALVVAVAVIGGSLILVNSGEGEDASPRGSIVPSETLSTAKSASDVHSVRRDESSLPKGEKDPAPSSQPERKLSVVWVDDGLAAVGTPLSLRRSDLAIKTPRISLSLDEKGEAEIGHLPPGNYDVHHYGFGKQYLLVPADDSPLRLEIDGGTRVVGQVIDEAGSSIGGARLWTSGSLSVTGRFVAVIAEDGRFEFNHAAIDQSFACQLPDGRWSEARVVRGTPDPLVTLELHVKASEIPVRGIVTRGDGAPLANAFVDVRSKLPVVTLDTHGRLPHLPRRVKTDEEGRFEVKLPADAGRIQLRVASLGFAPSLRVIEIQDVADAVQIVLEPGTEVFGRIANVEGRGLPNVSVRANALGKVSFQVITDAKGRYRLLGLPTAEWNFLIDAGSRGRTEHRARIGFRDSRVEIDHVIVRSEGVHGLIVDAKGLPAEGLIVIPVASHHVVLSGVSSDANGRFFIPLGRTEFDSVLIHVRTDSPPVALHVVGSDTLHITLDERSQWSPSAYVRGRIEAPADESLRLRIEHHGSTWSRPCAWSPKLGTYRVGPLPPGGYDLVVVNGSDVRLRIPVRLERDGEVNLGVHKVKPVR